MEAQKLQTDIFFKQRLNAKQLMFSVGVRHTVPFSNLFQEYTLKLYHASEKHFLWSFSYVGLSFANQSKSFSRGGAMPHTLRST